MEFNELRPDQMDELFAGTHLCQEDSGECGGGGHRVLFLYSAHLHAHVSGFDHDRDAQRIERFLNAVPNLNGQPFLNLQSTGKGLHDSGDFG